MVIHVGTMTALLTDYLFTVLHISASPRVFEAKENGEKGGGWREMEMV